MPRGKNYVNHNRGVYLKASGKKNFKMETCFYGAGCTRPDCIYYHPDRDSNNGNSVGSRLTEPCMAFLAGYCTFSASGCRKRHPGKEEKKRLVDNYRKMKCRYGDECKTKGCLFIHPGDEGWDNNNSNGNGCNNVMDTSVSSYAAAFPPIGEQQQQAQCTPIPNSSWKPEPLPQCNPIPNSSWKPEPLPQSNPIPNSSWKPEPLPGSSSSSSIGNNTNNNTNWSMQLPSTSTATACWQPSLPQEQQQQFPSTTTTWEPKSASFGDLTDYQQEQSFVPLAEQENISSAPQQQQYQQHQWQQPSVAASSSGPSTVAPAESSAAFPDLAPTDTLNTFAKEFVPGGGYR